MVVPAVEMTEGRRAGEADEDMVSVNSSTEYYFVWLFGCRLSDLFVRWLCLSLVEMCWLHAMLV
jgi:hypothetical protein